MVTDADVEELPEIERVWAWRHRALVDLGISFVDAERLVHVQDVAHQASELVAAGCPPDLVVRILAP